MFKEIAMDPECMSDTDYYHLVKRDFGPEEGRYLVADLKPWARDAKRALDKDNKLDRMKKHGIMEFLIGIQKGKDVEGLIFPEFRRSVRQKDDRWDAWIDKQNELGRFSTIISKRARKGWISHEDILERCDAWKVRNSFSVEKDVKVIVDTMDVILRISKEVLLEDRFVEPDNPIVKEIIKRASRINIRSVVIVSSKVRKWRGGNESDPVNNVKWARENQDLVKNEFSTLYNVPDDSNMSIILIIAPEKYFHARFFTTDRGSILLDQGFELKGVMDKNINQERHQGKFLLTLNSETERLRLEDHIERLLSRNNATKIVLRP